MACHDHIDDGDDLEVISRLEMLLSVQVREEASGISTKMKMFLDLKSLKNCRDELSRCQTKLEGAKSEIQKWRSSVQNESFVPTGADPCLSYSSDPKLLLSYLQTLRSLEESLREQSAVRDLRAQLKPASMQNLVEEKDEKVKELQDNIAAVSFTPQSKMGKMLMAKCRTLQEENDEIGNRANEGKMHELAMKRAFQKSQNVILRS